MIKAILRSMLKEASILPYDDMMNIPKTIVLFDEHFTWGDYYKMTPKEFART